MLDIKKIEAAINQISAERNLDKDVLIDIIEAAIRTAFKKDYGHKDNVVNVNLNIESGNIEISLEKTVVETIENPYAEISLEELGEDAEHFDIGDVVEIDVSDQLDNEDVQEQF